MKNNRPKGKKLKLNSMAQKTDPYGTTYLEAALSGSTQMIVTEKLLSMRQDLPSLMLIQTHPLPNETYLIRLCDPHFQKLNSDLNKALFSIDCCISYQVTAHSRLLGRLLHGVTCLHVGEGR